MAEYTPTRDLRMGGGEGRSYGQLLVDELKPRIDQRFRTRTGPEDTGVGGSSLGGLISLFLGLTHPRVFGKVAVMSPSLWWDQRSILNLVSRTEANPRFRLWLDMGTAEGTRHLRDADMLYRMLLGRGWTDGRDLKYRRVEGGLHNEQAWADRFGEVLQFLFPASADRALAVAETA
jgi:predicted alpha/beta superfamily hydrolase